MHVHLPAAHPTAPHHYLMHLGVDPSAQGLGIGRGLLAPVLDRCDREGSSAYLETAAERNLGSYGRSGFRVTAEVPIAGGPTIWGMWRDPVALRSES